MRLFIGIELPDAIKQTLLEFQSELRHHGVDGLWKSEENFHITLEFLGELDHNALPIITETLSKGVRKHSRFMLSIGGLGAFPSFKRPHTLWTGVGGSLSELDQLRDEIHTELAKNGFILEDRKFKPHITLASRPKLYDIDLSVFHTKKLGEFIVKEVVLFESRAIGGKRTYMNLYSTSLYPQF
ncbi:RNA 2',3'-cyclic phosphodiesterase [Desulfosporosinus metallidurans]|uniref:RNA 2',3'-cyclic phosphodiesterase n=1 Tax=Desulfosporosinus metallidurans TaxID=1888891 RepID=A0A1Q8R0B5_9FIRM|nr:RNA 2',3'-cyclic phosphodiesterase [Desulfosporosinus metallidurans]OLN32830.1 2'-5' RNA ligase [Desulfosporosinus metallidurans]